MPDVQITILNAHRGTLSDNAGQFHLAVPQAGAVQVRFSYIGYSTKELNIDLNPRGNPSLSIGLIPENIVLPEVQVEATKSPRNLSLPARTYYRFTPNSQEMRSAKQPSDLLKRLPEVDVKSPGPGQTPQISLRGSQANQVLILINGQPINAGNRAQFDINQIPLHAISEIQVAPGNQSAQYGNQAMGGVVNFVLSPRRYSDQSGISTSFGSWGQRKISVSNDTNRKLWSLNLHASMDDAANQFSYSDTENGVSATRKNTAARHRSVWMEAIWHPTPNVRWDNQGFMNSGTQLLPGPLLELTPDASRQSQQMHFMSQFSVNRLQWNLSGRSDMDYSTQHQTARQSVFGGYDLKNVSTFFEQAFKVHRDIIKNAGTSMEVIWRHEALDSHDNLRPQYSLGLHDRQSFALVLSGEAHFKLKNLLITPGVFSRLEKAGALEKAITYQGNLRFEFSQITTWLKVGTGYRLPSFWELFWVPDAYAIGNPDLNPERSTDREWGIRTHDIGRFRINFTTTIYQQEYTGLISWVRGYANRFYPENLDSARIEGFSISASFSPWQNHLTVGLSYDAKDPRNLTSGPNSYLMVLPYRALDNLTCNVQWQFNDWYCHTTYHTQGRTYIRKANTKWLEPFSEWNISTGYQFHIRPGTIAADLTLFNLTDSRYEVLERYPMPGRHWGFTISFTH